MSTRRTLARLGALTATAGAVTLMAAGPASAHVTATPSVANAGEYTVLTVAVPHGCDGSATTRIEVKIPEEVLSVTPTRNPFWTEKVTIEKLDEPATDADGNEVTERVDTVVYTAETPLPDGVRDSFELSFQVPDVAGETLTFPTVQTCEQGSTAWTEVPEEGQDAHELEHPAPAFEVLPALGDGHGEAAEAADPGDPAAGAEAAAEGEVEEAEGSDTLAWIGLGAGLLGLAAGLTALARSGRAR